MKTMEENRALSIAVYIMVALNGLLLSANGLFGTASASDPTRPNPDGHAKRGPMAEGRPPSVCARFGVHAWRPTSPLHSRTR
jgi:hypothetical protein